MAGSACIPEFEGLKKNNDEIRERLERRTIELARANRELQFEIVERRRVEIELRAAKAHLENIFNNVIPLCITSFDHEILGANDVYKSIFGNATEYHNRLKCYKLRPGSACHTDECPLERIKQGAGEVTLETTKKDGNGLSRHYIVTARPFLNAEKELIGIVETFQDITIRKQVEEEKAKLIAELAEALAKVKTLSGLLPICSSCKKIRDDKGYWNQIEAYIQEHSDAEFSHGICPECARKYYPDFNLYEDEPG